MENSKLTNKYMVFQCDKCKRFLYCKENQKEKKCPMCHHVNPILDERMRYKENGAIFGKTLTEAANEVIKRQNAYSMSKTINFTSLKGNINFRPAINLTNNQFDHTILKSSNNLPLNRIIKSILDWQLQEHIDPNVGFPKYMLNIILGELGFNDREIFNIINQIHKMGFLKTKNKDYCSLLFNQSFGGLIT